MREIDVLGVTIKDYPLKELLNKTSEFLNNDGVKTMSWLSANVILSVSENYEQREWVDSLDLMICDQAGVLKTGRAAAQLQIDGKSEDFLENHLKYLANNGASLVFVSDRIQNLDKFSEWIGKHNDRLNITGSYLIDKVDDMDDLFNRLNTDMPQVVYTCLPWLIQGELLARAREVSNASFWLSFLPEMINGDSSDTENKGSAWFERFIFGRRVVNYKKKEKHSKKGIGKNV